MRPSINPTLVAPPGTYRGRVVDHVRTPLYGGAYALILSSGSTSVLGMVYWTLAARLYEPSALGINAAVISSMTFLSYLAQLNMSGALSRFVPTAGTATRRLISSAYLAAGVISALASLIFLVGIQHWAPEASGLVAAAPLAVWFVVGTIAWSIFALQDGVLTGLRQTIWVPISNTAFAIAKIVLLIVFASGVVGFGIFASWTIPAAIMLIPVNLLIFLRFVPRHAVARTAEVMEAGTRQIVRYLVGDYVGSLLVNASVSLLPLIVLASLGATASAYFYIGWTIAYSLQLMSLNIATSLMVEGAARRESLESDGMRALVLLIRLQVPLILGVFVFAGIILRLFGEQYQTESEGLLRVLTLAVLPHGINAIFLSMARVRRQVGRVVIVQGALAGLSISLTLVLLGPLGILGVSIAWLTAQTLVAVVLLATQLIPMWRSNAGATALPGYLPGRLADLVPRAALVEPDPWVAAGGAAVDLPELARLYEIFDTQRIEWTLIRDRRPGARDDVDLLVHPDDVRSLRSLLRELGFIELVSHGRGTHRFFTAFDGPNRRFTQLDIVTDLAFGRFFELETGLGELALSRRRRSGGGLTLDPDDAFWCLLFHCLLDKRAISMERAAGLQRLAERAVADGPFGRLADRCLPSPWDAAGVLEAVRTGELDRVARLGPSIALRLRLQDPVGSTTRWVRGVLGRAVEPFIKARRGGLTVALLGLDGAGKSTLADGIAASYATRIRLVYMGLWKRGSGRASNLSSAVEVVLRPARIWARYLVGQVYRASGSIVIFDRYTYDAVIPPRGRLIALKRAYFWVLAHLLPSPDLTLLLDAPVEVLDARKPDAAAHHRAADAIAMREMASRLSRAAVVDVSGSSAGVLDDVTTRIWQAQASRWGGDAGVGGLGLVRRFDASILAPVANGRRRIISARASRTSTDVSAVVAHLRAEGILDGESIQRTFVTDTGVRVAWIARGDAPPRLVLKVGHRGQDQTLLAHVSAVDKLRADDHLADLRDALPLVRSSGRLDDIAYVVEDPLPGVGGDLLIRDPRVRPGFLIAAADWIDTLHRQTSVRREVDEALIETWIDRPAATIADLLVGRAGARRRLRTLARLAATLREELTGQQVDIGWVHGDYWAGNILASDDGTRILGVVDWDLAGSPELPLHDVLHLLLYARRLNGDLELGEIVASALRRPSWDPTEQHILDTRTVGWPLDPDGVRRAIVLSWLRHVGVFAGVGSHGTNRVWLRRNVDPVLDG